MCERLRMAARSASFGATSTSRVRLASSALAPLPRGSVTSRATSLAKVCSECDPLMPSHPLPVLSLLM
jgi:hypothetical protein